jgi:hypothetical protein
MKFKFDVQKKSSSSKEMNSNKKIGFFSQRGVKTYHSFHGVTCGLQPAATVHDSMFSYMLFPQLFPVIT